MQATQNGDNIVHPVVGGNIEVLIDKIKFLKEYGYTVHLHLNELSNNKALGRSLNRFLEEGRYIPPEVIKAYGDTPTQNFNTIINTEGLVDGYSHYSNDVARDQKPKLIKISENDREFDERLLESRRISDETRQAEIPETRNSNTTESVNTEATSDNGAAFSSLQSRKLHHTTAAEQKYIRKICDKLGRKVVFENITPETLRGRYGIDTKGQTPDGYIDKDGVIHIGFTVVDPINFIFKHELTHFGEGTEQYNKFVDVVKGSKIFKEWLAERTKLSATENSLEVLIATAREEIMNSRSGDASVDVGEAMAELIADFVGDCLFTENGSGLEALVSSINVKDRPAFIQYILDFLAYLKKKLSGNNEIVFEISHLEDSFNRMLSEAHQSTIKNNSEIKFSKPNIDKYGYNADNVSRANKQGELINGYYYALTKSEWTTFYNEITNNGYLATAIVGTVAPIVVNDKLIIAERLYTGKDAHDYVVVDAYQLQGTYDGGDIFAEFIEEMNERGIVYDAKTFSIILSRFIARTFTTGILTRYSRDGMQYVVSASKGENSADNEGIHTDSQEEIAGERVSLRDKSSVQEDNELPINSDRDAVDIGNDRISTEDIRLSMPRKNNNSVDTYSEEQYNNFGWASYNRVITTAERETLLSRYADYKHNKDKYPTTRFGETVIHSTECPDVIMYVKGDIDSPQVTKVVRINADEANVKEIVLRNEREGNNQSLEIVKKYYGDWILDINHKRDYASYWEYIAREKGNNRTEGDRDSETVGIRESSTEQNTKNDRAGLEESAFSMPKFSIPQSTKTLLDKYENGEVSRERMEEQLDELWGAAIEKYGSIEEGENAKTPIAVPKQVNDNKFTERLKGIFKKSYYCKRYLLLVFL